MTKREIYETYKQKRRKKIKDPKKLIKSAVKRVGKYYEYTTQDGILLRNSKKTELYKDLAVMRGCYVA